ncbi:Family of unknown function [Lutibacter agarilyticus]|uniref:Translocation and assembly module TamB C-terminal domain-containing protein n=1 Tax=Lutibacter agarilyticus TaxID=1109740 RepID=A0A238X1C7_9FLAO|nr:translocation/assembly module TamB domain-containing protein [Lutibacter agarilyticus]SNR52677.1 Family of unknown function [Lutibacter agarilyticus]
MLIILAVLSLLLSLPFVQTKLGNSATSFLQKEFDVDIKVERIDMSILGSVQFENVLIKDHHADSLIYVENLESSLYSFTKIMNNKLEFGSISLDNFMLNIKTYKNEVDDGLTVFVDKFSSEDDSETPSTFKLTSDALFLNKGYVEIIDENIENVTPIFFKNIKGLGNDFKIEGPNVSVAISDFSFVENHNINVTSFSSNFYYTKSAMQFLNTILETDTSNLAADIEFNYKREDFSDFNNKVNILGTLKESHISLTDLKSFYNEIGTEDVLYLTANISGQLNSLVIKNLKLKSEANAIIDGDLHLVNSFNTENGFSLEADFNNLTSDYEHLKILLPNLLGANLPVALKDLGNFKLKGKTYVTSNLISAKVLIDTELGVAETDLELSDLHNIENASYKGSIKTIDFKLGTILNDDLMGIVSLDAEIDGEGFSFDNINSSIKGVISKFEYNTYPYKNVSVNGIVKNKHFNGEMEVNDDNIKLNFNGLADFSKDVYKFDFKTAVDYCDLYKLNIFKRDTISILKGDIDINFTGNKLDNLVGEINFKNSLYTNQKGDYFFKDFAITSSNIDSIRTVTINSPEIIQGEVTGQFKFNELGKLVQNSIGSIYTNYEPFKVTQNQYLDFRFEIYNKIVELFLPEVVLSANTFINGTIDADKNLFKLKVKSPRVKAYSAQIDSVLLQIDNKNPLFNTQLIIDNIKSNIYNVSDLYLVNKTLNDTLYFGAQFKGGKYKTETYNLAFYHTFNKENQSVVGVQKSSFNFKNNEWFINPNNNDDNKLVVNAASKTYTFSPFLISSKEQSIDFSGVINDTISKDLKFNFKNVNLDAITPEIDSLNLEGIINGNIQYTEFNEMVRPSVNLSVTNFNINNSYQGNLDINVEGKNSVTQYLLDISLERENEVNFSAIGEIDFATPKPTLDVVINFEEFKLDAFSPLGEDVFNKIRGYAYGTVHATGLVSNPTMEGDLFLDEAGMYFPYLNVNYDFLGTSVINFRNQTFDFEDVTLRDVKHGTKASLTGTLKHQNFEVWSLNLAVESNNILVLDTEEEETSLYYGTAYFDGNATIVGPTDKLLIDITGKTNKGTHFIMPISDVKTAETSQLIRFINTDPFVEDEEIRKAFISDKLKGLTMNFNLEVTKEAVFEMVIDKVSRSYLKGSGEGNLQIELDTKDKFNMYGDFVIDNGIYDFKYGGFISKPFSVKKGGVISWSGDPLTANMDIQAIYRVSANPRTLLENLNSSRKIPVDLITRFTGELFNSTIDFDIEIPNSSSTVASELAFKLSNDKTTQFIALLVTGSFYNEGDLGANSNTVLYGTGMDMLTNAFDNILNSDDSRFRLTPVYTVGENNAVDNLDINDQVSLALDYQVNERILINGKVGMPIGTGTQTDIIGEVNVEFLMNEAGTLRSSVFNRQNDIQYSNQDEEGYTQGVGLNYQIDFDNSKELLEKLSLKKKKVIDSVGINNQAIDTIKNQKLVNFKTKKKQEDE